MANYNKIGKKMIKQLDKSIKVTLLIAFSIGLPLVLFGLGYLINALHTAGLIK